MADKKQIEVTIPVPWSLQPVTITFFGIAGIAIVAVVGALATIAWQICT